MEFVGYFLWAWAIDLPLATEAIQACLPLRLQLVFLGTRFLLLFETVDVAMFYFADLPACSISLRVVQADVFARGASFSG